MRKVLAALLVVAFVVGLVSFAFAEEAKKATYVGVKQCAMCHKGDAKGKMFEIWSESKHAKAFATLGGEEAAAVMKKLGKSGSAAEDKDCLGCHVINAADKESGVSCEACHGAGSEYKAMKVMKDHAAAVAAGLNEKPKEACVKCHNDKNPTHKGEFKFEESWKKIAHKKPAK